MAWHEGKPEYRSSPTSLHMRENFAYLKALVDLLSGAEVTQPELAVLHGATAAPAANKVAIRDSSGIVKGAELNITGAFDRDETSWECEALAGAVSVGDRVLVSASYFVEGVTPGMALDLTLTRKAGGANVVFIGTGGANYVRQHAIVDADGVCEIHITAQCRVSSAGTLTFRAYAPYEYAWTDRLTSVGGFFLTRA